GGSVFGTEAGGATVAIVGVSELQAAKLLPGDLEALRQRPGVTALTPVSRYTGQAQTFYNQWTARPQLNGVDPGAIAGFELEVTSGEAELGRWQVFVGAKVAETFSDPTIRSGDNRVPAFDLQGQTLTVRLTRQAEDGTTSHRVLRLSVAGVLAPR